MPMLLGRLSRSFAVWLIVLAVGFSATPHWATTIFYDSFSTDVNGGNPAIQGSDIGAAWLVEENPDSFVSTFIDYPTDFVELLSQSGSGRYGRMFGVIEDPGVTIGMTVVAQAYVRAYNSALQDVAAGYGAIIGSSGNTYDAPSAFDVRFDSTNGSVYYIDNHGAQRYTGLYVNTNNFGPGQNVISIAANYATQTFSIAVDNMTTANSVDLQFRNSVTSLSSIQFAAEETNQQNGRVTYDVGGVSVEVGAPPPATPQVPFLTSGSRVDPVIREADGTWTHWRIRNTDTYEISYRTSTDDGLTWGAFQRATALDQDYSTIGAVMKDSNGEILYMMPRLYGNSNGTPGENYFLSPYAVKSSGDRTQWTTPTKIVDGFAPYLSRPIQLSGGRILVPINLADPDEVSGLHYSTAMWSDDGGLTWSISDSKLRSPVPFGFNGASDGAVEPVVLDQPEYGRQWMLLRTQDDYLYESYSYDGGETWSEAKRSIFASSSSPADMIRLPDGRVLLIWNNTRNIPLYRGAEVYSGRDALHAAISENGGATWTGFREIYLDPTRHDTPPQSGDRGVGYPYAVLMSDNQRVGIMTGQGPGEALLHFDPAYLYETARYSDFSYGLDGWSAWTHIGSASRGWRDRIVGPELVADPNATGNFYLHLNRTSFSQDGDGATWNFTAATEGTLTLRMLIKSGAKEVRIGLADRFFDPTDPTGDDDSIFKLYINSAGHLVNSSNNDFTFLTEQWYEVAVQWNLDDASAYLLVDGEFVATLPQVNLTDIGVSYLRLRSPNLASLDPNGFLVDWVSVEVTSSWFTASSVPEPSACLMLSFSALAIFGRRRKSMATT